MYGGSLKCYTVFKGLEYLTISFLYKLIKTLESNGEIGKRYQIIYRGETKVVNKYRKNQPQ